MRTLLTLIFSWLLPGRGKRRRPAGHPVTAALPTRPLIVAPSLPSPFSPRSPRPPELLRGEDTPLVRPYLLAHERERERRQHWVGRRAAVLAALGRDRLAGVTA